MCPIWAIDKTLLCTTTPLRVDLGALTICNILICRCMQKHIQHNKDERPQFFRKIYLSLYLKGFERVTKGVICERWVRDRTDLQHIDPHQLFWLQQHFFTVLLGCSTGGLGVQPLLGHGSHSSIFSQTDLNFLSPGLYNNLTSTYFLRASRLYSIQPVDSQCYPLISSTGYTCYLHRWISSFDSLAGVNILQSSLNHFSKFHMWNFSSRLSPSPSHTHFTE